MNKIQLRNRAEIQGLKNILAKRTDKQSLNEVDIPGKQARVKKVLLGKIDQTQLDSIIKIVFDADPTLEKKYVEWVARQLANKAIELPKDTQRLQRALNTFYRDKQKFTKQDINQYKNFTDLEKEFAEVEKEQSALAKKEEYIRNELKKTNIRGLQDKHIQDQKVEQILEIDPSKDKSYIEWITKGVIGGEIILPEDLERTKKELKHFHENKDLYDYSDIKYYKPETLGIAYAEIVKDPSFGKFEIKEFNNAELVYDDGTWRAIYIHGDPNTDKTHGKTKKDPNNDVISALIFYSQGTRWCTANPSNANYYLSQGHLVLFAKRSKKVALMNLGSSSLQNPANGDLQHSNPDQYKEVVNIIGQIYETGEEKK